MLVASTAAAACVLVGGLALMAFSRLGLSLLSLLQPIVAATSLYIRRRARMAIFTMSILVFVYVSVKRVVARCAGLCGRGPPRPVPQMSDVLPTVPPPPRASGFTVDDTEAPTNGLSSIM